MFVRGCMRFSLESVFTRFLYFTKRIFVFSPFHLWVVKRRRKRLVRIIKTSQSIRVHGLKVFRIAVFLINIVWHMHVRFQRCIYKLWELFMLCVRFSVRFHNAVVVVVSLLTFRLISNSRPVWVEQVFSCTFKIHFTTEIRAVFINFSSTFPSDWRKLQENDWREILITSQLHI